MDRVQALLALENGEIPVYLHIPEEKITLLSPRDCWCSGDEQCITRLKNELGEENVVLK
jgi:DNA polymerase-3 subunit alpha